MKIYIYKNGLCDPAKNIGVARRFYKVNEVDDYINMFVASIDPKYLSNWRIFITDDNIEFAAVDHYVLMGEPLTILLGNIEEVDVLERAKHCNQRVKDKEAARQRSLLKANIAK